VSEEPMYMLFDVKERKPTKQIQSFRERERLAVLDLISARRKKREKKNAIKKGKGKCHIATSEMNSRLQCQAVEVGLAL
jgi:hypothetical protein